VRRRLYTLEPWFIRALIPDQMAGTYMLFRNGQPIYAGRSDRNLRQRLSAHAHGQRGDYFDYESTTGARQAFDLECAMFHALANDCENIAHPAAPRGEQARCFICQAVSDYRCG
jgi:hypothetical protein